MSTVSGQMSKVKKQTSFVFFGTDEFSVIVLEELKKAGLIPALIVTAPDRPAGRGMRLTPPPIKVWGDSMRVKTLQPEKLDKAISYKLKAKSWDMFIVASYGKIIPKEILDIPKHGTLNVHPSLLPQFRGPSPIHSQILKNLRIVGVTIILMDEKTDHGPIIAQEALEFRISNFEFRKLRDELAKLSGKLLAETIPKWIAGKITPEEQNHEKATYTKKVTKEDGLIRLDDKSKLNYRKFLAFHPWPGIYFFDTSGRRVKITDAELKDNKFVIKKVTPEGKREMPYGDFLKN